jgi:hypothetical protein
MRRRGWLNAATLAPSKTYSKSLTGIVWRRRNCLNKPNFFFYSDQAAWVNERESTDQVLWKKLRHTITLARFSLLYFEYPY